MTNSTSPQPDCSVIKGDTWVKPYFSQYRPQLLRTMVLGLITFMFATLLMFTAGYLICRTTEEQNGILMVMLPIVLVQIFGIGKPIARYLERLVSHDWVFRMTSSLRQRLYSVLETQAMHLKRTHQTGDFLGLIAEDIGHIQNLYLRTIFPTIIAWLFYAALVVALGLVSLPFAVFVLAILGGLALVLPLASIAANRTRMERQKAAKNTLYTQLTDNIFGASDWVFAGRGQEYLNNSKHAQEQLRTDQAAVNRYARINDTLATVLFGIAAVVTLVWAGTHFGGQMAGPANWIAAFVLGVFPLIEVFMPLPMAATQAYTHLDSIKRLNTLGEARLEDRTDEDDKPLSLFAAALDGASSINNPVREVAPWTLDKDNPQATEQGGTTQSNNVLCPQGYDIHIDNVRFLYPESPRPVLDGITLHVTQGDKVAILGRSGSGKTTLAQLIRGDLSPQTGTVFIGGVQTTQLGEQISNYVGVVSQQAYLFNRTLRDNLTIGKPHATDKELWEVLRAVELEQMARALPNGLDTMVEEAGSRFSGGEKHRIALARVLLADVEIVVLDEPTVGLDPETEAGLLSTLFKVLEGKTVLMITHHLQGAAHFDRIVFLEDGHIEMDGSPAELEMNSARYRQLLDFDRGL